MHEVTERHQDPSFSAEDIQVSDSMIEAGMAVLEETGTWPISRFTVERAFQAMCRCAIEESPRAKSAPLGSRR